MESKQKDKFRILVIGDPHFKVSNVRETEEMSEKILSTAFSISPDLIVCLGDVLDRHDQISVFPFKRAVEFLSKLASIAEVVVLIGNHDRPNNSTYLTDEHPFLACKQWKNLTIVDSVVSKEYLGRKFLFVPYVPSGRFAETLEIDPEWKNSTCIFAHQEFTGAKMGPVISSVENWRLDFPLIVSGHIHDFQEVAPNLLYVGTPIQHGFADSIDKTISLFTWDFSNSSPNYSHERIDLGCQKKKVIHVSPNQIDSFHPAQNTVTKLVIEGTASELKALIKSSKVSTLREAGVEVRFKTLNETPSFRYSKRNYQETLRNLIGEDSRQLKWYTQISSS